MLSAVDVPPTSRNVSSPKRTTYPQFVCVPVSNVMCCCCPYFALQLPTFSTLLESFFFKMSLSAQEYDSKLATLVHQLFASAGRKKDVSTSIKQHETQTLYTEDEINMKRETGWNSTTNLSLDRVIDSQRVALTEPPPPAVSKHTAFERYGINPLSKQSAVDRWRRAMKTDGSYFVRAQHESTKLTEKKKPKSSSKTGKKKVKATRKKLEEERQRSGPLWRLDVEDGFHNCPNCHEKLTCDVEVTKVAAIPLPPQQPAAGSARRRPQSARSTRPSSKTQQRRSSGSLNLAATAYDYDGPLTRSATGAAGAVPHHHQQQQQGYNGSRPQSAMAAPPRPATAASNGHRVPTRPSTAKGPRRSRYT